MSLRRAVHGSALIVLVSAAVLLAAGRADAQPIVLRAVNVNCGQPGQTIAAALRRQVVGGGLVVNITGTCNEHVDIFRDDVILRGAAAGATIHGPTTADSTVFIDGAKRVHLQDLTITGGSDGVNGTRGASFFLENVTVQGALRLGVVVSTGTSVIISGSVIRQSGSNGVTASQTSALTITNSTVEGNGAGIVAVRSSYLRVGQDAASSQTPGPVIVQNNTGGGITVSESSSANILAATVQNNGGNGIYVGRSSHADIGIGSFNLVAANTIMNNGAGSSGILVEGASANIVGNTITGNGTGVQFINGGNGRLGIRPDTIYLGNTISSNQFSGLNINSGSTAVIGANVISANGAAGTVGARFGIFVSQGAANLIGQNTIENHADSGIFVRQGSLFLGNGFGSLDTTGNLIRNNGTGAEAASNRSGIFLFEGATAELRSVTLSGNTFANLQMFLGGVVDVRSSTLSDPIPAPVGSPGGFNIIVGTRGTARVGLGTTMSGAPGDAVSLNNGAAFEIRNDVATTISGSGGLPINCFGDEVSIVIPTTGAVPIFTGNAGGDTPSSNCTGF
jgi:hypothetical protein